MVTLLLTLAGRASAGCAIDGPPDATFEVVPRAEHVRIVIELWLGGADPAWAAAILDALDARGIPAMLVVPAAPPDPAVAALLGRARKGPHDVAIALRRDEAPTDKAKLRALRDLVRPVTAEAGRVRTVTSPVRSRVAEALLGKAGFRSLIAEEGPPGAEPRMAGLFEGQPRTRVVLPPGPYEDQCGSDPHVAPFTPGAADRAGLAVLRAARVQGTPIVRVALSGSGGRDTDAVVLGRWLDEVVTPSGARVVTAEQARIAVLQGMRHPASLPDVPLDVGGRMVGVDQVQSAAGGLAGAADATAGAAVVPRVLPGDLNPTEAFYAFVAILSGEVEGNAVRLGPLRGPSSVARSSLTGPIEVPPAAVRTLAEQLGSAMPSEIPAAMAVDGRLLTAGELLVVLASAVRGDDPARTGPVAVPDPNQRGLGWGESTVP